MERGAEARSHDIAPRSPETLPQGSDGFDSRRGRPGTEDLGKTGHEIEGARS